MAATASRDAEEEVKNGEDAEEKHGGRGGKRVRMSHDVVKALIRTRMDFEPRFVAANKSLIGTKKVKELFVDIGKEIDDVLGLGIKKGDEEKEDEAVERYTLRRS